MQTGSPQTTALPSGAELIAANSYPPVLPEAAIGPFIASLKSEETRSNAAKVIEASREGMRAAVEGYLSALDAAAKGGDVAGIFAQAHEMRGVAELAGLGVAGRMANGLCQYLDALEGAAPDAATVRLHVDAIERVVRGEDHGAIAAVVAEELTALVIRKLGEAHMSGLPASARR